MFDKKIQKFFESVDVVSDLGGFYVRLDTQPIKTPKNSTFVVPSKTLADLVALEWSVQEAEIKPLTMPLMRLTCTAIDKIAPVRSGVIEQLAQYGINDLLCYRAERPDDLVTLQHKRWQPILNWMEQTNKVPLNVTSGVIHVSQPHDTIDKLIALIDVYDDFTIAGLGEITQLTGSLALGLATVECHIDGHFAFEASQIDNDWQTKQWGEDIEAVARRNNLETDIKIATQFLSALV
jgi:chaperone required for assembly of F1-ATPase